MQYGNNVGVLRLAAIMASGSTIAATVEINQGWAS
jgi:hypothetical protein